MKVNKISAAGITLLLLLLVAVRLFEHRLFYDPLLVFFKSSNKPIPPYDTVKLFLGLLLRYFLNSIFSVGIIWLAFKDKAIVKLTALLLALFFAIFVVAFFIVINSDSPSLLLLFYIRRFLIQPLFLILFLPAFYYQRHIK